MGDLVQIFGFEIWIWIFSSLPICYAEINVEINIVPYRSILSSVFDDFIITRLTMTIIIILTTIIIDFDKQVKL